MSRFFLVGCWNHDNCDGTRLDYRQSVFETIRKNGRQYDFGVIAGDNIYSHKNAIGKKAYHTNTWRFATDTLPSLGVPVYGTVGNHDVSNKRVLTEQLGLKTAGDVSFLGPTNCYVIQPTLGVRLVFIDTNTLTMDGPPSLYNNNGTSAIIDEYLQYKSDDDVLGWLKTQLAQPFDGWTVVVGHEPIISIKSKATKSPPQSVNPENGGIVTELKVTSLNRYYDLLDIMSGHSKLIYMCADVHSFQAWNFAWNNNNSIPMVVTGTGGASPDNPPVPFDRIYTTNEMPMELVATAAPYRYCEVEVNGNGDHLRVSYVPIGCETNAKNQIDLMLYSNSRLTKASPPSTSLAFLRQCSEPRPIEERYCDSSEGNAVLEGGRKSKKRNSKSIKIKK